MPGSVDSADEYYERLQAIFPSLYINNSNPRFYISMELSALNRTLSISDEIMVLFKYNCACFNHCKRPKNDVMLLKKKPNKSQITIEDAINGMIIAGYHAKCNHCYLESFEQRTNNEYIAMFGS
jgi:hypothetical protein